jgi:hypothetical protein
MIRMKKHIITLYMNDPLGKRCMFSMETARGAEKEFVVEIVVIKKTSKEYCQIKDPLPCPSLVVNGRIIARNETVTQQALRAAIMGDSVVLDHGWGKNAEQTASAQHDST